MNDYIKWENNKDFTDWILTMEYAEETDKGIKPFMSLGVLLYMYEAWCACWIQCAVRFRMSGGDNAFHGD